MVNFAYIPLAILATIIPLATANNCHKDLIYCGSSLKKKGNYDALIRAKLEAMCRFYQRGH
ncbi:Uncharacterized protein TPAR_08415 [Tolypocladium paradoxum]|uniref:Uncharacterized protein n=1 Tax=Tolypocladium paradoxum TaxID=94208 RepID=A0A2S4KME8_9HYPO|nr:Uncharacterized protein TPAR_08415 [Tolypocladium paradoxum]